MKHDHTSIVRLTSAVTAGLTLFILPQAASAAGVIAGTLIENTASATYTSGTASGSISSNTVTVKVDELLDVAVAGLTTTPVSTGSASVVLEYELTNTGNGAEAFNITVDPAVAGNDFDASIQTIAYDSNGNGTYDAGVDTVITNGGATSAIDADGAVKIFVVVTLPSGAADGESSQVRLTADAVTGTGTPGTVFSAQGAGGGDAVVGASGASDSDNDSMIASLATVALAKSAAIVDPFGGAQPVPGAVITYTLVATVSGTGQAEGLSVTDVIPAGTTYQTSTLKLDGAALTDAVDSDVGTASSSGIDVDLGTVAGGTTKTVTFDVKIN